MPVKKKYAPASRLKNMIAFLKSSMFTYPFLTVAGYSFAVSFTFLNGGEYFFFAQESLSFKFWLSGWHVVTCLFHFEPFFE